jgi:TonB family protein
LANRIFILIFVVIFFNSVALAQNQTELSSKMRAALEQGDMDAALLSADALYALTVEQNDLAAAGSTAFARAKILASLNRHVDAGDAYKDCADHYAAQNAMGQSLNCKYEAAYSYLDGGKKGTALNELRDNLKELEKIGQGQSGLAVKVYILLAREVLPSKIEDRVDSQADRKRSVGYADKALSALDKMGKTESELYASALFMKGVALEDAKKYEEAVPVYENAIKIYKKLPNRDEAFLGNALTRLSIAKNGEDRIKRPGNSVTVTDKAGNDVLLTIRKKKKIRTPRVDRKKMVDGARVRALITLNDDGSVANIGILESMPEKDYGEAFTKAVSTWKFTAPEGVLLRDIPPFVYGLTFSVKRRY